jgi:hypothetical protein
MEESFKRVPFVALLLGVSMYLAPPSNAAPPPHQTATQSESHLAPKETQATTPIGKPNANRLRTFISPNGSFEFKYSDLLVRCPGDSCDAYFPMCDNEFSSGSDTLACFAYPKSRFKDYPTFEAGTFSAAEIKDATTQKDCVNFPSDAYFDLRRKSLTRIFKGVEFQQFELAEGGMSQGLDRQVYRSFHEGTCYELSVKIATITPGVLAPGTGKEFSEKDRKEVRDRLEQSLHSFRFLN